MDSPRGVSMSYDEGYGGYDQSQQIQYDESGGYYDENGGYYDANVRAHTRAREQCDLAANPRVVVMWCRCRGSTTLQREGRKRRTVRLAAAATAKAVAGCGVPRHGCISVHARACVCACLRLRMARWCGFPCFICREVSGRAGSSPSSVLVRS